MRLILNRVRSAAQKNGTKLKKKSKTHRRHLKVTCPTAEAREQQRHSFHSVHLKRLREHLDTMLI